MPAFDTPGPIAATVVVAGAQVRVTASDRTDTVVLVDPIDKSSQSDVKVAAKTKVDFAGGQLSVTSLSTPTLTVRRSQCGSARSAQHTDRWSRATFSK